MVLARAAVGLLAHAGMVAGMMDFRDFATGNVRTVRFADPGVPPPSFIYSTDENWPPYNIDAPHLEPFPGCDARYASVCAVQHSIRLVTTARLALCADFAADNVTRAAAMDRVNANEFVAEGSAGFGVFVFAEDGTILADSLKPDLIGTAINGILASGFIAQASMLDYIEWVTRYNGGFVPHYTTRLTPNPTNVLSGQAPLSASMYVESCPSGERIGVAFGREAIPAVTPCSALTNAMCSIVNLRRIVGLTLVDSLNAAYMEQHKEVSAKITYTPYYAVDDFYMFLYQLSNYGYPGNDSHVNIGPLEDTTSTNFAHNTLKNAITGRNLTFLAGVMEGIPRGDWLLVQINNAAWTGGAWRTYLWSTPALGEHFKLALCVGFVYNGTGYMLGSGTTHMGSAPAQAANCEVCSAEHATACATANTKWLVAHARAEILTPDGVWSRITNDEWFGAMHPNRPAVQEYAGTWPAGFYVFAFDYDGECVADGKVDTNVGKDAATVIGAAVHSAFKSIADNGGGWLEYELADGVKRIAFILKVAKWGRFFYTGVAFKKERAPWHSDCTSMHSEPCSAGNAEALVGMANADIISAADETALGTALQMIGDRTDHYADASVGDFSVQVYDENWGCSTIMSNLGVVCPRAIPPTWKSSLEAASAVESGAWATLQATDKEPATNAYVFRVTWSPPTTAAITKDFILVAYVDASPGPQRCASGSSCPADAGCVAGRCLCNAGFRTHFDEETSVCGDLKPANMSCIDVRGLDCTGVPTGQACPSCAEGYFCPEGVPLACPAGQYCPAGSVSPQLCPPGSKGTTARATTEASCTKCPPGTSQARGGQTECLACEQGSVSAGEGNVACSRCEIGQYQDSDGQTSCQACPSPFTTIFRAATSREDCVCPRGTLERIGARLVSCASCPEGMSCEEQNSTEVAIPRPGQTATGPYPRALEGYMSTIERPLEPFKCKESSWCPGGPPDSCATSRDPDTTGCAKCLPDTRTTNDGSCTKCDPGVSGIIVVLAVVGGLLGLGLLVVLVNKSQAKQNASITACVIVMGLTVTAVQTLGIYNNMTVRWVEPLSSMFSVLSVLSFDLKVLQVECVFGQASITSFTLRQLVAPGGALFICLVVAVKKRFVDRGTIFAVESINGVGSVFQLFFVSIVVSCLTPFICYAHPNDRGYSMISDPSVLCFEGVGDHASLVVVSILAVLFVLVPYLCLAGFATLRYKRAMADTHSSFLHLRMFRFLFFRYNPESYWYGMATLIRGLSVCLIPVIFRDAPSMQICGMAMLLLAFSMLQLYNRPWRGFVPNMMDGAICNMMVLLMVCVAMSTDFSDSDTIVGTVGAIVFVTLFVVVLGAIGHGVYRRLVPTPYFHRFVCHHKADASSQARLLQIMLIAKTGQSCFLDSDNLSNLEELFDIVRSKVGRLIVYLTADTLRRPWCAGEVTMTWQCHQRIMMVYTPAFVPPTMDTLVTDNIQKYLASADFKLVEYGITDEFIAQAFRWALYDKVDQYKIPDSLLGRARFEAVTDAIVKNGKSGMGNSVSSSASEISKCKPKSLVVSSLPYDDESTASAAVLVRKIQAAVNESISAGITFLADITDPTNQKIAQVISSARVVVVVMTPGTLESAQQLQVILQVIGDEVPYIPVSTPNFRFPAQQFYEKDSMEARFGGENATDCATRLQLFFKIISVSFTTYAADDVLEAQASALVKRIDALTKAQGDIHRQVTSKQITLEDEVPGTVSKVKSSRSVGSADTAWSSRLLDTVCGEIQC